MNEQLGRIVKTNSGDYKIVSVHPFDAELVNLIRVAKETKKYPAYFWFAKILKNGETSKKQGFAAFVFENGNYIKL